MPDAIEQQIEDRIVAVLKGLSFETSDPSVQAIDTATAIVVRKILNRELLHERGHQDEVLPGILVVQGNTQVPARAGVNCRNDVFYTWLIAIIDRDNNLRSEGLKTYRAWRQLVLHAFSHRHDGGWPFGTDGTVGDTLVEQINVVDEERWGPLREFQCGVQLTVKTREPWG